MYVYYSRCSHRKKMLSAFVTLGLHIFYDIRVFACTNYQIVMVWIKNYF